MNALAKMTTKNWDGPERRCIATGARAPKAGLIRFVIGPDDIVVPDLAERLPGRGIWVSADINAMNQAIEKNLFSRSAKQKAVVPDDLLDMTRRLLAKRCLDVIGLARRADELVVGFDRVLETLERGGARAVVIAHDAGRGRRDIEQAAEKTPIARGLAAAELADASGKGAVSFLALTRPGLAKRLVEESDRLTGIRPVEVDV